MHSKFRWNGLQCKVEFGYCTVTENEGKPMFWYNYECNYNPRTKKQIRDAGKKMAVIPAIRITQNGSTFCISNHFGIGYHKVTNGGMGNYAHFSLPDDTFELCKTVPDYVIFGLRQFDLEGYTDHERGRREWQERTHPAEFKIMTSIREQFKK